MIPPRFFGIATHYFTTARLLQFPCFIMPLRKGWIMSLDARNDALAAHLDTYTLGLSSRRIPCLTAAASQASVTRYLLAEQPGHLGPR